MTPPNGSSEFPRPEQPPRPFPISSAIQTLLATLPVAVVYATDRGLQRGFGNVIPFLPAVVSQLDNATDEKKRDVRLAIADTATALLSLFAARAIK